MKNSTENTTTVADRDQLRVAFLQHIGWEDAEVTSLQPDASFRRYFRLTRNNKARVSETSMLMDAPPQYENTDLFLKITSHLASRGIRVPEIYETDELNGFVLLEDLGNATFSRLLNAGESEKQLYRLATDVLLQIHADQAICSIELPHYDASAALQEAELFVDWYLPAVRGGPLDSELCKSFSAAILQTYDSLPVVEPTLVLRDFHVDNLMRVKDQCAVLDYQDALIGSPAYDLVSLLEDARRDIHPDLSADLLAYYLRGRNIDFDKKKFLTHAYFWGVQRHLKVAGIFTRLWLRDNKPIYLPHLSRVIKLLKIGLSRPGLEPVQDWFNNHSISVQHAQFRVEREELLKLLQL